MKVLIAFDGSECSDLAIADLPSAGLPENSEAVVLSAADTFIPDDQAPHLDADPTLTRHLDRARAHAKEALAKAEAAARVGAEKVQALFPRWHVMSRAQADAPAWAIVSAAEEWGADLIVCGSHGYGFFNRARLGSVSEKVLLEAKCSVRVAKKPDHAPNQPLKVLLAYDGSEDAVAALNMLLERGYPVSTEVHVISSIDLRMATAISYLSVFANELLMATHDEDTALVHSMVNEAVAKLIKRRYVASGVVKEGDPKKQIIHYAEEWKADVIVAGAHGMTRTERFLMGSVSTALASRAHCSVEIVRPKAKL